MAVSSCTVWRGLPHTFRMHIALDATGVALHVAALALSIPLSGIFIPGRCRSHAYRSGDCAFLVYGYAKNERDSINDRELKALKQLAAVQLSLTPAQLRVALQQGALIEVST